MAEKSERSSKSERLEASDKNEKQDREERHKALELAIGAIEKHFGKGSIMRLGDAARMRIAVIPTGALSLDVALGIGGIPRGRVTEVFGPEAGGKTTFALHVIAEAQKAGGTAAFIDAEHALDPDYASHIGVDVANLLVSQPDDGEQALDIVDTLVRSNAVDIIVIDSVAALVPRAEIEGEMSDQQVGLQARLMSKGLRKLAGLAGRSKTAIVFINQLREKIGITYGNPEVTTGGRALRFYASLRLEIRRVEAIKRDTTEIGNRVRVKVVKNKLAPPFRQAEFDILFGRGISVEGCILDMAAESGIVAKSGSWYSYNSQKIGQGRDNARDFLASNPDVLKEIEAKVRSHLELNSVAPLGGSPVEEPEMAGVS